MSIRSDAGACKYCGVVLLAAQMVRLGQAGEYEYACVGCAKEFKLGLPSGTRTPP